MNWSVWDRTPPMSCPECFGLSGSTRPAWPGLNRWCCATWNGSARCALSSANATVLAQPAPDFAAVANQPATTPLSLKVFLQSNHPSMPNLVLTPAQSDDLVNYILSLKRD